MSLSACNQLGYRENCIYFMHPVNDDDRWVGVLDGRWEHITKLKLVKISFTIYEFPIRLFCYIRPSQNKSKQNIVML